MEVFGKLSAYELLASVVAFATGIYTFWKGFVQGPRLHFFVADYIYFVATHENRSPRLYMMGSLVNHGGHAGTLLRLELSVYGPNKVHQQFVWDEFFQFDAFGEAFIKQSDPHAVTTAQGSSISVNVGFRPLRI